MVQRPLYPPTPRSGLGLFLQGSSLRQDPFLWLENSNSLEVGAWVNEQNALANKVLQSIPGRDAIRDHLSRVHSSAMESPAFQKGDFQFQSRKDRGLEQSKLVVIYPDGRERVLIDPNHWDHGVDSGFKGASISPDGSKLVYQVAHNNSDSCTLHLLDVRSGQRSPLDSIPGVYGEVVWDEDGEGFFYVRKQMESGGSFATGYHQIGTPMDDDTTLVESMLGLHKAGHYLVIEGTMRGTSPSDPPISSVMIRPRSEPTGPAPFRDLIRGVQSDFSHFVEVDGKLLMVAHDPSHKGKVLRVDPDQVGPPTWDEVVPSEPNAVLQALWGVGEQLVLNYLEDGVNRLKLCKSDGSELRDIELPADGVVERLVEEDREDRLLLRLESFTHPTEFLSLDPETGNVSSLGQIEVEGFDPARYEVERLAYPSKDGTDIPMTLIRKKDKDGSDPAPTLLYGYGGYSIPMLSDFKPSLIPWLDRGGVFALAHIRGGGEGGKAWHEGGVRENKQNTVDDLVAAGEYLVDQKITDRSKLAVQGGSNGGLIAGAALTHRPDLFRAGLVDVPILDMVRFSAMEDGNAGGVEFGDPDDPSQMPALTELSPYNRLNESQLYPAVLFSTRDSDNRCPPAHSWKMAAAMQQDMLTKGPVLVRTMEKAGHSGAANISRMIEEKADQYAFLFQQLGHAIDGTPAPERPELWQLPEPKSA